MLQHYLQNTGYVEYEAEILVIMFCDELVKIKEIF